MFCGFNWGYRRVNWFVFGVGIIFFLLFGVVVVVGIYNMLSFLGKDYFLEGDEFYDDFIEVMEKGGFIGYLFFNYFVLFKLYNLKYKMLEK